MTYPKELRDMAEGFAIAQLTCIVDECPDWYAAFCELQDADYEQTEFAYFDPLGYLDHLNAGELLLLVESEADTIHELLKNAYGMGVVSK